MKFLKNPRLLFILSMSIFGTIAVFVRHVPLASGEIALYRAVLATVMIGSFMLVTRRRVPFASIKRELPLLIFSGVALGVNWILLFEAYKHTTVSSATLSYYFAPMLVTVISTFLFREKLSKIQILCFVMTTVGVVLITGIGSVGTSDLVGIAFGLGAACFYAAMMLLNKYIKGVGGLDRTLYQFLAAVVTLLPYVALTSGFNFTSLNGTALPSLLIVGIVHTGLTYLMYFTSLKEMKGQSAAILSYIDPLVAVLISVFVLGESITLPQIIGGILILGFSIVNEVAPTAARKKEK